MKRPNRSHGIFGGYHVLLFGDLYQLKPLRGSWIFSVKRQLADGSERYEPNPLWRFQMIELVEIMRQRDDVPFADALRTLRTQGLHGLSDAQVALFDTRISFASSSERAESSAI